MTTGNAFASTADAWNGDRAQAIRGSILDGSFRHCDKSRCPAIQEATLPQIADLDPTNEIEAAILEGHINLLWLPKKIDLSHDKSCNLSCPSCRTEMIVLKERERDELVERTERHLLPLLREADYVNITGSGDPFASKAFRNLLARLSAQDFPNLKIQLASNAVLFDEAAWAQMDHLRGRISQLHISIDAATPETYAVLRRGGDWDRLMRNLTFLAGLHAEGAFGSMKLVFVMQEMNFEEMPAFVRLARSLGKVGTHFSALQNWGTYSDGDYMARAIHLPDHPRHRELRAVLARAEFDGADVVLGDLSSLRGTRPAVAAE
jgi:MoaA/NifB/PqqE/SkfB family radical SAM enzyme